MCTVLALLVSCTGGTNDLDRSGLEGKVKSITEHQFDATAKDGRWVAGQISYFGHHILNYNSDGFYTGSIALTQEGDTLGYTTCRRENGYLVEEVFHSSAGDSNSRTLMDRLSDAEENFEIWNGNQLQAEGANYFDSKGRITRQVRVVNDKEIVYQFVYEKNLLVANYEEEVTGERTSAQQYEYKEFDDRGNWTVKLVYRGEEKISPIVVITRKLEYY
jgi:hypothetical protein